MADIDCIIKEGGVNEPAGIQGAARFQWRLEAGFPAGPGWRGKPS